MSPSTPPNALYCEQGKNKLLSFTRTSFHAVIPVHLCSFFTLTSCITQARQLLPQLGHHYRYQSSEHCIK